MTELAELEALHLRGREFDRADLQIIESVVQEYYDQGRTRISEVVCERLDWRQPNGWLKDRACRDVLRRLEALELIRLPPPLQKRSSNRQVTSAELGDCLAEYDLSTSFKKFPSEVELVFSKGNKEERVWNQVVSKYHYIGHSAIVGRCIKYLVKSRERLLGAICFSSPAWELKARDTLLESVGISDVRRYTINNSRFLILPNVDVKNLASHVLSLASKRVVQDWSSYYAITPLVAETFVQPSLFQGTCYRAANWTEIGRTKGYRKRGAEHHNSQEPKLIFLYGLNSQIRRQLYELTRQVE